MRASWGFLLCGALMTAGCLGASTASDPNATGDPTGNEQPGTGTGTGASTGTDAGATPSDLADPASPPGADLAMSPIVECTTMPSLDRYEYWTASGEGTTTPATGSILVKSGARYIAKVDFVNAEWHVIPVLMANKFDAQVDFSKSSGFSITYSATEDLYVQLRPGSHWSGGDKYLTLIPSTGGQVQTKTISFAPQNWTTLPELGTPTYSFADALKEVRGFVFVGKKPTKLEFHGMRVDGYVPPCN